MVAKYGADINTDLREEARDLYDAYVREGGGEGRGAGWSGTGWGQRAFADRGLHISFGSSSRVTSRSGCRCA